MKEKDPYKRLAAHLDDLPGGFPPTESGVEQRILRRLFFRGGSTPGRSPDIDP